MLHRVYSAFAMCLSKYTIVTLPKMEWDEDLAPVSEAFLPAVGLAIGLTWWIFAALCRWLLPDILAAALAALYPFAVAGFENLRAFAHVCGSILENRKIARMDTCMQVLPAALMLLQFAACEGLDRPFALAMIPVLSRSCRVLMQMMPKKSEGEREEMQAPRALLYIELGVAAGAMVLMLLFAGGSGLLCGAAVLLSCWAMIRGFSGSGNEISGEEHLFANTAAEFCGLLILAAL